MSQEYDNAWATAEMSWSMEKNNTEMGLGLNLDILELLWHVRRNKMLVTTNRKKYFKTRAARIMCALN